ncbi:MAG: pyruvate kinase, partial [Planctomycetota bacterium]
MGLDGSEPAAGVSSPMLLTKILATVGPACRDAATLTRMIEEGARAFRVNFSHGDFPD